jgi:hypothetical protein
MTSTSEDNNTQVWTPEIPEGMEIGLITIRSKSEEELNAVLDYFKRKYQPCIFTVSHIPKREREYYHKIIMYNTPLISTFSDEEQKKENVQE